MSRVRRYYDRNTWKFLLTGSEKAIHRELWAPGVATRRDAIHHAHALVDAELVELARDGGATRVLDLGCGVGTAGLYLAARHPVEVVGVSISPAQIRLAERYAARAGARPGRVRFAVADFTALPADLVGFDLAFAIESFVHAPSADGFFREAARALRPGGRLVVIDDVLTGDGDDPRLADVRTGWHASTLVTVAQAAALAAPHGLALRDAPDLSPYQRLGRPRDRLIRALQPVLRPARTVSMWAESLVGGDALQRCHRAGLLAYRMLRFERTAV